MKGFICEECGFVSLKGAPDNCPVCGAPRKSFQEKDTIKTVNDEGPSEKHVPVIKIVKQCGLMGEGCTDVHAKIGEVAHPMEAKHSIQFIDFYVDDEFVERVTLTPSLNPAAGAHVKANSGKLTVIEFCNLHGHWISEQNL